MLRVEDLHTYYGHIHALQGISLNIREGEIVTLLGNNGAGKSTALKTISGLLKPTKGAITLEAERIDKLSPHSIVERGVSHVPEGRRIFSRLTVMENLEMGAYTRKNKREIQEDLARVFELLPKLAERRTQIGGTLSGGEQQMLAMGRALMTRPRVLLLDEPSMGLAPIILETIFNAIIDINEQGTTILLVEQNASLALSVADRGYVIQSGRIVLHERAEELMGNEMVRKLYFGEEIES
ncbi:MAG: ABC transporter ATP-binding protein [Candidatus Tectomicrobia bacterium]|uniref:ABC transporter ATP-binding protein n=1 Tax=Tectimicrobiota bacterium TaxID=2528274 RepID=A0A933LR11_UNCTE|nr:ABC transporter ATP-binding protein [Candidatus Tectomicrobia bacterium]